MARPKIDPELKKKQRAITLNDIDDLLLSTEFGTRQKALNFLVHFLGAYPKKVKFYNNQIKEIKNGKPVSN